MTAADDQRETQAAAGNSGELIAYQPLVRAVMWNQWLWTSGYTLTSGGFLLYFAKRLGAVELTIAVLLVLPELSGVAALLSRPIIRLVGSRKRVFIVCSLLARGLLICVPLWGFRSLQPEWTDSLGLELGLLVAIFALHSIAYTAYLSWLADLAPEHQWGRFFARRNVAKIIALLIVPVAGAFLRDYARKHLPPAAELAVFETAFSLGILLMVLSLWPMWSLPDVPLARTPADDPLANRSGILQAPRKTWQKLVGVWQQPSLRWLILHNWCLAFANGLTQYTFFNLQFKVLAIGLTAYHLLNCLMRVIKLPVSLIAGELSDRMGNRKVLIGSLLIATSGLLFWLPATPEQPWWIVGGYVCWGVFAAANISGRNWLLSLAPKGDQLTELALFHHMGGLLAGLSGLLGGYWAASLQRDYPQGLTWLPVAITGFQAMIVLSLLGRWSSILLLLPARDPRAIPD